MKYTINPRFTILLLFILAIALVRIFIIQVPSPISTYTPLGAMCMFGGAYFSNRWKAIFLPLCILLISDIFINQVVYEGKYGIMYSGWPFIYAIFALITVYSRKILERVNLQNILFGALAASVGHWILADTYTFIAGGTDLRTMLPLSRDWAGYMQCIKQGLPFMKNFLIGTLGYSALLFGVFELLQVRFPKLAIA